MLALDRAGAGFRRARNAVRAVAVLLLAASVAGNLLAAAAYRAQTDQYHGVSLLAGGREAEAAPVLEAALRLDGRLGAARMALALVALRTGRAPEAPGLIAEAIAHQPAAAPNYYQTYGPALVQLGRLGELETLLRAALVRVPDAAGLHQDLGLLLARTGRAAEARTALARALELNPGLPLAREQLQLLDATSPPPFLRR